MILISWLLAAAGVVTTAASPLELSTKLREVSQCPTWAFSFTIDGRLKLCLVKKPISYDLRGQSILNCKTRKKP